MIIPITLFLIILVLACLGLELAQPGIGLSVMFVGILAALAAGCMRVKLR